MKEFYVLEDIENYDLIEDVLKINEKIDNIRKADSKIYYNDDNTVCTNDKEVYDFYNNLANAYYTIQYVEDNLDGLGFSDEEVDTFYNDVNYYLNRQSELEQIIVFARKLKDIILK